MQALDRADMTIQAIYVYFHMELFEGVLPGCHVFFQSKIDRTLGFLPSSSLDKSDNRIALHRDFFGAVPTLMAMQVLVHEMIHFWQFYFGKPMEDKGHNAEFESKSKAIGLMPSSTGGRSGERTGHILIDYVIQGGQFQRSAPWAVAMWETAFPLDGLRAEAARYYAAKIKHRMG